MGGERLLWGCSIVGEWEREGGCENGLGLRAVGMRGFMRCIRVWGREERRVDEHGGCAAWNVNDIEGVRVVT
jgi:hypothetical protein